MFGPFEGLQEDFRNPTQAAEILETQPTCKRLALGERDVSDEEITMKVLIRNVDAGSVIGKAGSAINELQTQSGTRLRMSRTNQCFPGTSDRLLLISGTVGSALIAVHLLLHRIRKYDKEAVNGSPMTFRMVVPNRVCGGLIGEKGGTIHAIAEDSGAKVAVSSHKDMRPGIHERIVSCTGGRSQILRALALISSVLLEDASYMDTEFLLTYDSCVSLPFQAIVGSVANPTTAHPLHEPSSGSGHVLPSNGTSAEQSSVSVVVNDQYVGALLGKGGRNLHELMRLSSTKITVSRREEMPASTRERTICIKGSPEGCALARWLMDQQLASVMPPSH